MPVKFSDIVKMDDVEKLNQRQVFILNAMPDAWQSYATELKEAAEYLWQNEGNGMRVSANSRIAGGIDSSKTDTISRTYILLSGFAIENLLKGLLVAQEPTLLANGTISGKLKSHKLLDIAASITDLKLSEEEIMLCKTAQDAIPYWGRYPVPLRFEDVHREVAASKEYRNTFLSLHYRLGKMIHTIVRDGWDSGLGPRISKIRSKEFGDTIDPNGSFFD